ncbi:hypothetical protein Aoki45_02900 [Algoriphagus sp. oki45]|nr:hypothetical protein Aoki45_02900 [Algoriphagus sp. oki45]
MILRRLREINFKNISNLLKTNVLTQKNLYVCVQALSERNQNQVISKRLKCVAKSKSCIKWPKSIVVENGGQGHSPRKPTIYWHSSVAKV